MYYRIKIEELNNGKKLYIPQVSKLEIYGRWIKKQRLVWYNIHKAYGTTFGTSTETETRYSNEEDALKVIEDYKNRHQIVEDNKVKSVTYKDV